MPKERVEITREEYNTVKVNELELYNLAVKKAIELSYHPSAFGLYNPSTAIIDDIYYIDWEHSSNKG